MTAQTTDAQTAGAGAADEQSAEQFTVVVNHEEQFSVWWADRDLPPGWRAAGFTGTRQACLDHIDVIWTDMRPASLRAFMAEHAEHAESVRA